MTLVSAALTKEVIKLRKRIMDGKLVGGEKKAEGKNTETLEFFRQ